jgi:hypothetical protein
VGGCALTRSPGRLPSPSGLFWVTGSEGPPPGVRWPPASGGLRTQQRSARPTSAPGRSPPGGGTMPSAAWCARTASSATRACGPPVPWCRTSTQRPAGPGGVPVTRGRAGSAPCGQHCRRGTRACGATRTGRDGHTCSRRWPPAATAGTHRHPAQPRARPARRASAGLAGPQPSPAPGSRHFTRQARGDNHRHQQGQQRGQDHGQERASTPARSPVKATAVRIPAFCAPTTRPGRGYLDEDLRPRAQGANACCAARAGARG